MKDKCATVIVNIEPLEKKILKSLDKEARWGIKKAQSAGLIVEETNSESDWKEFYEIFKAVVRSGGADEQPYEKLRSLAHTLLVCRKDGRITGGAAIFFDPIYDINIPRLYKIASEHENLNLQPNNILIWHAILWSKDKGYKKFDLGGWQINASGHALGVNKFKEKWGDIVYHDVEYPFFRAIGRKLIRKSKLARVLYYKIRRRKTESL